MLNRIKNFGRTFLALFVSSGPKNSWTFSDFHKIAIVSTTGTVSSFLFGAIAWAAGGAIDHVSGLFLQSILGLTAILFSQLASLRFTGTAPV